MRQLFLQNLQTILIASLISNGQRRSEVESSIAGFFSFFSFFLTLYVACYRGDKLYRSKRGTKWGYTALDRAKRTPFCIPNKL